VQRLISSVLLHDSFVDDHWHEVKLTNYPHANVISDGLNRLSGCLRSASRLFACRVVVLYAKRSVVSPIYAAALEGGQLIQAFTFL